MSYNDERQGDSIASDGSTASDGPTAIDDAAVATKCLTNLSINLARPNNEAGGILRTLPTAGINRASGGISEGINENNETSP